MLLVLSDSCRLALIGAASALSLDSCFGSIHSGVGILDIVSSMDAMKNIALSPLSETGHVSSVRCCHYQHWCHGIRMSTNVLVPG